MSLRYKTASLPLLLMVFLLAFKNYEIWSSPSILSSIKAPVKKEGESGLNAVSKVAAEKSVSRDEIRVIAEKNMFNPERKEFSAPPSPQEDAKSISRPQIFLYGVVISEDYQTASIINPGRPLYKGERETKTVKVGDSVGGYKVAKILSDRIAMEGAGGAFEVLLYDPQAPKRRNVITTENKPAAVTRSLVRSEPPLTSAEKPSPPQSPEEKLSLPPAGAQKPPPLQVSPRKADGLREESVIQAPPLRPLPSTLRSTAGFRRGRGNFTYQPPAQGSLPSEASVQTVPSGSTVSSKP